MESDFIHPTEIIVTDEVRDLYEARQRNMVELTLIARRLKEIQAEQIQTQSDNAKIAKVIAAREAQNAPKPAFDHPIKPVDSFQFRKIGTVDLSITHVCKCGVEFHFYLDREKHLAEGRNGCGKNGEIHWINGTRKHILRDEKIVGNPIKAVQKPAKVTSAAPSDF